MRIHHDDWIAISLLPYLYAVDSAQQIPATIDRKQERALRDQYWALHLTELAPVKGG